MLRKLVILLTLALVQGILFAQDTDPAEDAQRNSIIEQRIEIIAEVFESEDLDYTTLFEDLSWYYDHPINLNNTTADELRRLYLLTEFQVAAIIDYRRKYGDFITIYELRGIELLDRYAIDLILPFVKVAPSGEKDKLEWGNVFKYGRHDLFLRYQRVLEEREGFSEISDSALAANPNSRYLGNPDRYYTRYRFRYRDRISFGVTMEKDPGEEFFNGTNKYGFDFYSMHAFYRSKGVVRQLALGDFQVEFGQGLTAWSGLAFGKSALVLSSKRQAQYLRPNTSAVENLFMRGAGVTLQQGGLKTTLFGSYKNIDANVDFDDTLSTGDFAVTSLQQSGLHRTVNETEDERSLSELMAGGHIAYEGETFEIGVTGLFTRYGANLNRSLSVYNQFEFSEQQLFNAGVDYNWIKGRVNFFGESAWSSNNAFAHLHGVQAAVDGRVTMILLYRNYGREYQGQLSNALAEGSRPANEEGIMLGGRVKISKSLNLTGYFDHFWSDWLRYRVFAPSSGYDALLQLDYFPQRNIQSYLRIRKRLKEQNVSGLEEGIYYTVPQERLNSRLHFAIQPNRRVKLKSRFEASFYSKGDETDWSVGYLLYQDVSVSMDRLPLTFTGRVALFESTFDTRLYAYENDVLYAFSIPAYNGRGSRMYLMIKYEPFDRVDIWLRVAQWFYNDRDVISSGLNEIQGNTQTEIKAQVRIKF